MKKKVAKKSSKKIKFNYKEFLIPAFVFLLLVFLLGFVHVGPSTGASVTDSSVLTGNTIWDSVRTTFDQWKIGDAQSFSDGIGKYLYWIMISLLIFSILSFANFPPQGFIRFIVGAIVGFLATAYITPAEIFLIITTYSALGLTLGVILPFMIMLMATVAIFSAGRKKGQGIGPAVLTLRIFINLLMWVVFEVFVVYKLIDFWNNDLIKAPVFMWILIIIMGLTLFMIVFHKYFLRFVIGMKVTAIGLEAKEATELAKLAK